MIEVPNERLRTSPGFFSLGFKGLKRTPTLTSVKKKKKKKVARHRAEPVNPAKNKYEKRKERKTKKETT
jgi:hypothetical protein